MTIVSPTSTNSKRRSSGMSLLFKSQVVIILTVLLLLITPLSSIAVPCFPNGPTLRTAVNLYITQGCSTNSTCAVGQQWGWPIGTWCTSGVTDMSLLITNGDVESDVGSKFNDDISDWDVRFCRRFSSDLLRSIWNMSHHWRWKKESDDVSTATPWLLIWSFFIHRLTLCSDFVR